MPGAHHDGVKPGSRRRFPLTGPPAPSARPPVRQAGCWGTAGGTTGGTGGALASTGAAFPAGTLLGAAGAIAAAGAGAVVVAGRRRETRAERPA
ncbi:hypothetical protein AB0P17_40830 [Streptomyces sp. NPDC088124]|uniref:hypothetical protein n=1 Tax=Streptomyces sp. NPDC088124 TaxID=3154654 RepID=UPI003443DFCA